MELQQPSLIPNGSLWRANFLVHGFADPVKTRNPIKMGIKFRDPAAAVTSGEKRGGAWLLP
jgi:hypothetical protein